MQAYRKDRNMVIGSTKNYTPLYKLVEGLGKPNREQFRVYTNRIIIDKSTMGAIDYESTIKNISYRFNTKTFKPFSIPVLVQPWAIDYALNDISQIFKRPVIAQQTNKPFKLNLAFKDNKIKLLFDENGVCSTKLILVFQSELTTKEIKNTNGFVSNMKFHGFVGIVVCPTKLENIVFPQKKEILEETSHINFEGLLDSDDSPEEEDDFPEEETKPTLKRLTKR